MVQSFNDLLSQLDYHLLNLLVPWIVSILMDWTKYFTHGNNVRAVQQQVYNIIYRWWFFKSGQDKTGQWGILHPKVMEKERKRWRREKKMERGEERKRRVSAQKKEWVNGRLPSLFLFSLLSLPFTLSSIKVAKASIQESVCKNQSQQSSGLSNPFVPRLSYIGHQILAIISLHHRVHYLQIMVLTQRQRDEL